MSPKHLQLGSTCGRAPHLEVHPLVQRPAPVELTQQAGAGYAEGGVAFGASAAGHVAEEVVPQLSQQPDASQQRHGGADLHHAQELSDSRRTSVLTQQP